MSDTRDGAPAGDAFLWLEAADDPRVRAWVEARNNETEKALCDAAFERDRAAVLTILNAPDRIPFITMRGSYVYNFWQDENNRKGVWRRTTLDSYRTAAPAWEAMLDVDALARDEGEDWVWQGCTTLPPAHRHGLVRLSRGGADAVVIREFDLTAKRFVADGFSLAEAKGSAGWLDRDTLLVSSALGGAAFETTSGYARTVRRWRRGTPFAQAQVVFECDRSEMVAFGWREHGSHPRTCFMRRPDFFSLAFCVEDDAGSRREVDVPADASLKLEGNWLLVNLRSDFSAAGRRYVAGSLLVADFAALLAGRRAFTVLFEPTPTCFLQQFVAAGDAVAINTLDDVRSNLLLARHREGGWRVEPAGGLPALQTFDVQRLRADDADGDEERERETFIVSTQSPIAPPALRLLRPGEAAAALKAAAARFDATGLTLTQHHAVSVDGRKIPYFQVGRAGMACDGSNACLMTGYGGFQIPLLPRYVASYGKLWLECGGVYVIANIRGGGEFGPDWHKAGMREGKKLAHDDFAAVARDLIARGVTRPARLACLGGSNGGLLVGNMLTRYAELFGAIECAVPLLDMKRYTRLTAGPSWIGEYGDPDKPEDWAFLQHISAYHQVDPKRRYPPVLLTTSARDDRVHPGHARKMAAKLMAQGHPVYFHEPLQGGHGAGADNAQFAFNLALGFAFLRRTIAADAAAPA